MPRPLHEIIAHIRAVSANPAVSTTLIQTEDLEALCDAAELDREKMVQAVMDAQHRKAKAALDAYEQNVDGDGNAGT